MKLRIDANMTLDVNQVERRIQTLFTFFRRFHDRVDERNQHFFNMSEQDPVLANPNDPDDPFHGIQPYQSDMARQLYDKLLDRLTENPTVIRCQLAPDTDAATNDAQDAELTLNAWLQDIKDSMGVSLIEALMPGPVREGLRALHWYRDDYSLPTPQYRWLDQLPEGKDAKSYQDMGTWCPECMGAGTVEAQSPPSEAAGDGGAAGGQGGADMAGTQAAMKPCPTCKGAGMQFPEQGRYRETPDALKARYQREKAQLGSPYCLEVLEPHHIAFTRGLGKTKGPSWVAVRKELARIEMDEDLAEEDDPLAEPDDVVVAPGIERATGSSGTYQTPSTPDYEDRVTLYQLWRVLPRGSGYKSRDGGGFEFYEATDGGPGGFRLRQAFRLPEGIRRLPFAICGGMRKGSSDPEFEWEPYLEGVFRQKPFLDRFKTLFLATQEMKTTAPFVEIRDPNIPALTQRMADGRDPNDLPSSQQTGQRTWGSKIQQLQFGGDPGLTQAFQTLVEEYMQMLPSTGETELSATTAPWTARIGLQMANAGPAFLLRTIADCLRECWQDIAHQCGIKDVSEGGLGEPTVTYAKGKGGGADRARTVSVEPGTWEALDVDVSILATSQTERTAMTQHGMELLGAGLITKNDFYKNYMGKEDPEAYEVEVMIETSLQPYELQFIQQIAAAKAGTRFLLGQDGEIVGPGGAPADPRQVLAANGYKPVPQVQGGPGQNQAVMPGLPSLNAPQTAPLQGIPA